MNDRNGSRDCNSQSLRPKRYERFVTSYLAYASPGGQTLSVDVSIRGVIRSGVTRWGRGRTVPGDTLQGGDTRRKKNCVGKFTKNSGETRSDR